MILETSFFLHDQDITGSFFGDVSPHLTHDTHQLDGTQATSFDLTANTFLLHQRAGIQQNHHFTNFGLNPLAIAKGIADAFLCGSGYMESNEHAMCSTYGFNILYKPTTIVGYRDDPAGGRRLWSGPPSAGVVEGSHFDWMNDHQVFTKKEKTNWLKHKYGPYLLEDALADQAKSAWNFGKKWGKKAGNLFNKGKKDNYLRSGEEDDDYAGSEFQRRDPPEVHLREGSLRPSNDHRGEKISPGVSLAPPSQIPRIPSNLNPLAYPTYDPYNQPYNGFNVVS